MPFYVATHIATKMTECTRHVWNCVLNHITNELNIIEYLYVHVFAGERFATMNVHLLSHITDCVRNWGPLWCYSCFSFESMNGFVKSFFHGTREMSQQVGSDM